MSMRDWQDWKNWYYVGEKLIKRNPCECGKGFICEFIQKWKHKITGARDKRRVRTYDCPDKCHQKTA